MSKQLGFYYDSSQCLQCYACEVACRSDHDVGLGVRWRRVWSRWYGEFPNPANIPLSSACLHCEKPSCLSACPANAIEKRAEDGVVVVHRDDCIGCQTNCTEACPYGAPQFGADGRMEKCNLCTDRTQVGLEPACVATCASGALKYGEIGALLALASEKGGERLAGPNKPSVVLVQGPNLAGVKADFRDFFNSSQKTNFRVR
jgi:anaerobic dimethyl sulfoxide reductase subunit B (iron-sulfur subunit)